MKGIREIKGRIKAVKSTAQITKAMQLVAASRMKRAQDRALASRPYSVLLEEIIESLEIKVTEWDHPLLTSRPTQHRGILVLSTDKGLCGSLNSNLFKLITSIEKTARFFCVGRKATQFLTRTGYDVVADFSVSDSVRYTEVRVVVESMIDAFMQGRIDTLEVLYPRYINTLTQEPALIELVPFEKKRDQLQQQKRHKKPLWETDERDFIFEPGITDVLSALIPLYIKQEIYQMILEAKASEQSARMVAMKNATDNAKMLVDNLVREYNKARQAAITQEILELSAAAAIAL